jgi:hypothetical protein
MDVPDKKSDSSESSYSSESNSSDQESSSSSSEKSYSESQQSSDHLLDELVENKLKLSPNKETNVANVARHLEMNGGANVLGLTEKQVSSESSQSDLSDSENELRLEESDEEMEQ